MWISRAWKLRGYSDRPVAVRRRKAAAGGASERLESRILLAGNVSVSINQTGVLITGDDQANDLELLAAPGSISLRGRNGTTINGADAPLVVSAASTTLDRALIVRLFGGGDIFTVGSDITVNGPVQISLGAGDDAVSMTGVRVNGRLSINTGAGVDSASLNRVVAGNDVSVESGNSVLLAIAESTLQKSLTAVTGGGADSILLTGTTVSGAVQLQTGRGDDTVALKNSTLQKSLYLDAGRGRDVAFLDGTTVSGRTSLWMRQGDDSIVIQGSSVLHQKLVVGALMGTDQLEISGAATIGSIRRYGSPGTTVETGQKDRIEAAGTGALAKAAALVAQSTPRLSVNVNPAESAENAGTSAFTIARSGSTVQAVTVTLSGNAVGRVTVPTQIVIPAGSQSASGTLLLLDNSLADGNAVVQISAAAAGFISGSHTFTVNDNEVAALQLAGSVTTIAENAAAGQTITVSRNTTDVSAALPVALSASNGRLSVPASVTIPAGATSTTFLAVPVDDQLVNGNASVVVTATATGLASGTLTVGLTDNDIRTLSLALSSAGIVEGAASAVTATVSRNTADNSQPLTVSLATTSARASLPATIQIPAGQSTAQFAVSAVDNLLLDGTATAQVSASAPDFGTGVATLTITDNETGSISLGSTVSSIAENAADGTVVTVSRTALDVSQALVVTLAATPAVLTLPAAVTIPAGSVSTTFSIKPVDDELASGNKLSNISGNASGYSAGTLAMTVVDNESPGLSLSPTQRSLTEGSTGTVVFTVSRNTADLSTPLSVTVSSPSSRLSFPLNVVIPSGARQETFSVSAVDDAIVSLTNSVAIQTTAAGYSAGQATVTITENDFFSLSIDPASLSLNELSGTVSTLVNLGRIADTNVPVSLSYSSPDMLTGPATVTIPVGQQSVEVFLNVIRGSVREGQRTGSVTASITGTTASDTASITVQDADSFQLTTDVSANEVVNSSDILITRSSNFLISGLTDPLATVSVDSDGDGQFDDASGIADATGDYSVTVPLTAGGPDRGDYHMVIRSSTASGVADTVLDVHFATGTLMRFETSVGIYDVELLDAEAPITVANFLSYQSSGKYDDLIVHRNVSDFVVQGGGFKVLDGNVTAVQTNPTIPNEFRAANSNVRGTLAMAMVSGNINSGSSQWFINVVDNTFLDTGKYTVFGRVIGSGMDVVDAINTLTPYNISSLYGNGALAEVPLFVPPPAGTPLSGSVTLQAGSTLLSGSGTSFSTELSPDAALSISGRTYHVQTISSNVSAVLKEAATTAVFNTTALKDILPDDAHFVVFSRIDELLPLLP